MTDLSQFSLTKQIALLKCWRGASKDAAKIAAYTEQIAALEHTLYVGSKPEPVQPKPLSRRAIDKLAAEMVAANAGELTMAQARRIVKASAK